MNEVKLCAQYNRLAEEPMLDLSHSSKQNISWWFNENTIHLTSSYDQKTHSSKAELFFTYLRKNG